ncbi:MAG: RimK family protein [Myxococcota bacterium]
MPVFLVLEKPDAWDLQVPGVSVVAAEDYLINPKYHDAKRAKVFNLCRTYSYQTVGYYVSLLASARGHRPLPSVATLQDLRQASLIRIASDGLDDQIQKALKDLKADRFELSIYFGRNLAGRYDRLVRALFNHFPAPLLRAEFRRKDRWRLENLKPIAADDIPASHYPFVREQAQRYFERPYPVTSSNTYRYDLGILVNHDEPDSPSDEKAIGRFIRAARKLSIDSTLLRKEDYGRIGEFDALFIRETTYVDHHTYRFARRAAAEGLVVIDDPESILRCTNKVYLAELFAKHGVAAPKTYIVHPHNLEAIEPKLTYPCVVKRPDSSFSLGVSKADDPAALREKLAEVFEQSELAVVQEFVRSDFDWRIGIIDGRALYACRYHFARGDWRIQTTDDHGKKRYGKVETLAIEDAPQAAVDLAL